MLMVRWCSKFIFDSTLLVENWELGFGTCVMAYLRINRFINAIHLGPTINTYQVQVQYYQNCYSTVPVLAYR